MAAVTETFNTPGTYTFVVPATVQYLDYEIHGAGGGGSGSDVGSAGGTGGDGARINGSMYVTAGNTLTIYVGGGGGGGVSNLVGAGGGNGGTNGSTAGKGGNGGDAGDSAASGGGGGGGAASYVYDSTALQYIVVAGGGGGAGGAGTQGAVQYNKNGGSASQTFSGTANLQNGGNASNFAGGTGGSQTRQATGNLNQNPLCLNVTDGWHTRSGAPQTNPTTAIRKLVILWNGTTIYYNTPANQTASQIVVGGYKYTPGTKRGGSPYGWCSNDTCGVCTAPNGDHCNSFDITRTAILDGPAGGGGGGGTPGGGAGATPSNDQNAGGGSGGGSYYNASYHTDPVVGLLVPNIATSNIGTGGGQSTAGESGSVTLTYDSEDGNPNPVVNFETISGANILTQYTTLDSVTVSGINIEVPCTANNGAEIIKNGTNVGASTTVVNGDILELTMQSPDVYTTVKTATLAWGDVGETVDAQWSIITKDPPLLIPNPFDFTDVNEQPLDTDIISDVAVITGLTEDALVSVTATINGLANQFASIILDGVDLNASSGLISNGQELQIRMKSGSTVNTVSSAFVTVGSGSIVDWDVTTILVIDDNPDPFNFINAENVAVNTLIESNVQTITGINTPALVSVSEQGGDASSYEIKIGDGAWVTPDATTKVANTQDLQVRTISPSQPNENKLAFVTVGQAGSSFTDEWRVITGTAGDTVPDQFTFNDRTNQFANTMIYSNTIVPAGITASASIIITTNVQQANFHAVSFDNGSTWTACPYTGSYTPGDPISLRLQTGDFGSPLTSITVNIGGVSDEWTVETLASSPEGNDKSTWYNATPRTKMDGLAIGTIISVFRDSQGNWGQLDGELDSRYPGFIECAGQQLSVLDYPDLWEVIGNRYGGDGSKFVSGQTVTYFGNFNLPDTRNRRMFGSGNVDGNSAASPIAPTRFAPPGISGTGSGETVGSVGGDWYIDTVDAGGPLPLEQVEDDGDGDDQGTSGAFFSIGNVTTTGYDGITGSINFNVQGNVSAFVGPLIDTLTDIPAHTHDMLSATSLDVNTGLLFWGAQAVYGDNQTVNNNNLSDWPGVPDAPSSNFSDWNFSISYTNWWASPTDGSLQLDNSGGSNNRWLGALDTLESTGNVGLYSPEGGTLTHSHYISNTEFGDSTTVYGWGNTNGAGTKTQGMGGGNTAEVLFNHTEMGSRINIGDFQLDSSKALIPTVKLKPNRTIPLIQPFFAAKFVIKAY
tara:strand:- start:4258 stop:7947 length:3690 start_codon:yes stop_codon:yes gene_type:complete